MRSEIGRDWIFWEPYGGLGDALGSSTLPQLVHEQLEGDFYLSSLYKPRNPDIVDLVWGENPYVAGWAKGPAKLGFRRGYNPTKSDSFISNLEIANGFKPTNSRPKIFYTPKPSGEFKSTVLVDLSSVTVAMGPYALPVPVIEHEILNLGQEYLFVLPKGLYRNMTDFFPSSLVRDNVIEVGNLFQYCDILASSIGLLGLQSGAISLGVALLDTNPNLQLTALMHPHLMASRSVRVMRNHIYSEVTYKVPSLLL